MIYYQPNKGDAVVTPHGPGVCTDDYWRDRDRYEITFPDGSKADYGAEGLRRP